MVTDEALMTRLRDIAERIDPVPDLVYELGRAAFSLRSLDAELAELVDDSALHTDSFAGVRSADSAVRMLYYESSELAVELHVTHREGRRSGLGQVIGGSATEVRVESTNRGDGQTVQIDDLGRFDLADLPGGPFRMHLLHPGRTLVITSWTTL